MTLELYTADGARLQLGKLVGRGGEGEVYAVNGAGDQLVKRYTLADLASREAKVRRMVAAELHRTTNLIAFPISPVKDARGKFAGFTMARVNGHEPLHELYSPGARKAAFPAANYKFLVRAAANVARVVGTAHAAGCVIGDINHSGVLVSTKNATAALIDADSFQITDGDLIHFCKVGVPEYTPPELQGQPLGAIPRTPTHDQFGLAVVVFQLLWMGRHPYSGRFSGGEMPVDRAIREFRFVYSKQRSVGMTPPPAVPSLKDIPAPLAQAFEQAFGPSGPTARPTAAQWVQLLDEFEQSLRTCEKNELHHYSSASHHCPWCHMEQAQHVLLFLPPHTTVEQVVALSLENIGRDLDGIWRTIESIQAPSTPTAPSFPPFAWTPSPDLATAQQQAQSGKLVGGGIAIAGVIALLAMPAAWFLWLAAIWFGVAQFSKTSNTPSNPLVQRYRDIETQWQRALSDWRDKNGAAPFEALKVSLRQMRSELQDLPKVEAANIESYHRNRRAAQLDAFLDGFQIRRVKISGIGPSRLATLTSYGIETAADITPGRILNVPGFGPATSKPLLAWRKHLEGRFVFHGTATAADTAALNTIRNTTASRSRELLERLRSGAQKLSQLAVELRARQQAHDPALATLHRQREQILGDLKHLGVTPPTVYVPPPPTYRTPPSGGRPYGAPQGGTNCPSCGSRMILRTARRGRNAGNRFYGCSRYPNCTVTRRFP
jgi:DNA-binding helix-hairpin-helix protein with protein kinase domain